MWLNIKTEYSFRSVFAPVERIIEKVKNNNAKFAGIADVNNTFGFVPWEKACIAAGIKPVFGVVLPVCPDLTEKDRRGILDNMTFIAKNQNGLKEIYKLVETSHKNFWFTPRLSYEELFEVSRDVLVISGRMEPPPRCDYQGLSMAPTIESDVPRISTINNHYIDAADAGVYETFADDRLLERSTFPLHIPTHQEFVNHTDSRKALKKMLKVAKSIEPVTLQKAPLVKYEHKAPGLLLLEKCLIGAKRLGIKIDKKKYKKRFDYEIEIITEKGFIDYFLVVADLMDYARKTNIMVGPGRGSSGGSLVCYLLGITGIDPIKHDLIFERFIDINRTDLPDIDLDFEDRKRHMILTQLSKDFQVCQIANISKLTPKANLNRAAKALFIPDYELTETKNLTSDKKADAVTVKEILTKTDPGKDLAKNFPAILDCIPLEDHALHSSIHAAGILVSNEPITNFCATITSRSKEDNPNPIACLDMAGVEYLNMLKIDALGLNTLAVLAATCDGIGKPYSWLYGIKDGDKKAYSLLNSGRMTGIFQLEGRSIRGLIKDMKLETIDDLSAVSALGRPGPMKVGSAVSYIKRKNKEEEISFPDSAKVIKKILKPTFGLVVYQEQVMAIAKKYAGMDWPNVIKLRKVIGKSKGSEELTKFREMFLEGAKKEGHKNGKAVWEQIKAMGAYGFNKSHSVAYGYITYWCAYLKAHHPLEFAVALLNNVDNDEKAIHILRYIREEEGIKHKAFDPVNSTKEWRVYKGKLLGSLTSIHNIGVAGANKIISCRKNGETIPPGIEKHLTNGITPFTHIYPRKQLYGDYKGKNINALLDGENMVVARLMSMNLRDANSTDKVRERGKRLEGNTTYLLMIMADDTGEIMAIINRQKYQEIGKEISETAKEAKSWFQMTGTYDPKNGLFFVEKINDITIEEGES